MIIMGKQPDEVTASELAEFHGMHRTLQAGHAMAEFFTEVTGRIPDEGPDIDNPLAFHCYDADRASWPAGGWRTTSGSPSATGIVQLGRLRHFGAGTLDRPWHPTFAPWRSAPGGAPEDGGGVRVLPKLGAPFYCFHDR